VTPDSTHTCLGPVASAPQRCGRLASATCCRAFVQDVVRVAMLCTICCCRDHFSTRVPLQPGPGAILKSGPNLHGISVAAVEQSASTACWARQRRLPRAEGIHSAASVLRFRHPRRSADDRDRSPHAPMVIRGVQAWPAFEAGPSFPHFLGRSKKWGRRRQSWQ